MSRVVVAAQRGYRLATRLSPSFGGTHGHNHYRHATAVLPSHALGGSWLRRPDDDNDDDDSAEPSSSLRGVPCIQTRQYHTSIRNDRAVAIMLGLGTVAAVSYSAAQGVKAYNEWKDSWPPEEEQEQTVASEDTTKAQDQQQKQKQQQQQETAQQKTPSEKRTQEGQRENIFKTWFGLGVGSKYYEGGFEDSMTRREAALILGVRESSSPARIKEAHRKLLILNHPDTGGSTYMAGKINEAKELLLKGKRGV